MYASGKLVKDGQGLQLGILSEVKTAQHWQVTMGKTQAVTTTAEELYTQALTFFKWCDDNPIFKPELIRSGVHTGSVFNNKVQRPYTLSGLCIHLNCSQDYIKSAAKSEIQNDFFFVANRMLDIIRTQLIEYTLTGEFTPILATKLLGVDVNKDNEDSGSINISVENSCPPLLDNEIQEN